MSVRRVASVTLAVLAAGVLMGLGCAYWLTVEPCAAVKVRWQVGLPEPARAAREQEFQLLFPQPQEPDTFLYDLLDTSEDNLRALVTAPEVADTAGIERRRYTLPPDFPYGQRWMWIGDRTPLLRRGGARWLAAASAISCLAGWLGGVAWRAR